MFCMFLILSLLQVALTSEGIISVDNGGIWGDWGDIEMCPTGTSARAFSLLVEPPVGGDDTALNGIKLYCAEPFSEVIKDAITSAKGPWGDWTKVYWCPAGELVSFSLKVEPPTDGDDTAANNIMFQCSDLKIFKGDGGTWGNFGTWSKICCSGICGIKTRVEKSQGKGDDTALNDVQLYCC